jgi:integrase
LSSSSVGTIYQRKDGRWEATLRLGGRRISRYAKTEREARQALKELLVQEHAGTLAPPTKLTVSQWVQEWMESLEGVRRPKTIQTYELALRPVVERVGAVKLNKLTPIVLARVFAEMRKIGLGSRRIQQSHTVLGTCLRQAVQLGVIPYSPLYRIEKPKHQYREKRYWNMDEARQFLDACLMPGHHYGPLFLFMAGTGLRRSEALGLRWQDIDLSGKTVTINRALVFVGERATVQPTKSRAGARSLSIPDVAARALQALPRPFDAEQAVFTSSAGTPPSPTNLRYALWRVCDRAGVPRLSPHGLRHMHGSMLLTVGVDLASVSKRLGHARVSTTAAHYTHQMRADVVASQAFDAAVGQ